MRQLFVLLLICSLVFVIGTQIVPFKGTLVSGVAYYRVGSGLVPAPGIQLYCAVGKYEGEIVHCSAIWGEDCTAGTSNRSAPRGLFHFYHPDKLQQGVSIMYRLDDTSECFNPGTPAGRYFSRFYTPTVSDQGLKLKASFLLAPTATAFQNARQATEEVTQIVAVRYFFFRHGISPTKKEENEDKVKQKIAEEARIVMDSLIQNSNPKLSKDQIKDQVLERLRIRKMRDGESLIPVLDWLPKDANSWITITESWNREKTFWQRLTAPK